MEKINVDISKAEVVVSTLKHALKHLEEEQEKVQKLSNDIRINIGQVKFELETWNKILKTSKEQDKLD